MPKTASCSFSICANGLRSSDRENFKPSEEAHWRSCHVDEPVKFTCPYTEHDVEHRRNPQKRYLFVCVCGKSRLLNSGSVKRHYTTCSTVRRQVIEARTSQSTSGPSDDPRPISEPDSFIHDASPTASSISGVVPYNNINSHQLEQLTIQVESVNSSVRILANEMRRLARSVNPNFECKLSAQCHVSFFNIHHTHTTDALFSFSKRVIANCRIPI
ncbi:MAG: hypothetical protein BYD32DRAFT_408038 [Podila humilis]|nr:MAG: hypothetical protein BYD32DRAFT_408038 [Podila humilis]